MNIHIGVGLSWFALAIGASLGMAAPNAAAADYITSFKSSNTARCLHSNAAGGVFTWPCDSANTYQDWILTPYSDGLYRLKNRRTGFCLTIPSSNNVPTSVACDGSIGQKWFFISHSGGTEYALMRMSTYRCVNNVSSSTVGSTDTQNCGIKSYDRWKLVP